MRSRSTAMVFSLSFTCSVGVVWAQTPGPTTTEIVLQPGFTPNPQVRSGGYVDVDPMSENDDGCPGTSGAATYTLHVNGQFPRLSVAAFGSFAPTLVIRGPDGRRVCNNGALGNFPGISMPFAAGAYQVWVGMPMAISWARHLLVVGTGPLPPPDLIERDARRVDEVPRTHAYELQAIPERATSSPIDLRSTGSRPVTAQGTGDGQVPVHRLSPDCFVGFVGTRPSHAMTLRGAARSLHVTVETEYGMASGGTMVMLRRPDGAYTCGQLDGDAVTFSDLPAGNYLLWVGARSVSDVFTHTLRVASGS